MKLTHDEQRALAFIAALLLVSAAVRLAALPEPAAIPGAGVDLDAHIAATGAAVAAEERRARPLAEGERIDPNRAPAEELDRLPGVGPALADRIVRSRESDGLFRSPADLRRVSGVGEKTADRLAAHLDFGTAGAGATGRAGARAGAGTGGPHTRGGAPARAVGVGPTSSSPATVDVNRADAAALETLPGVGPVLAGRIVAYRDTAGPFLAVDSLVAVPGIGPATLERLRSRVRVR